MTGGTGTAAADAPPVVVFVHVHYPKVWTAMARRLAERLDVPFRLLVTSSLPDPAFDLPPTPFHRGTRVLPVENRGRDIRPFLLALAAAGEFEVGLKLHTKRSTHRLEGDAWRDAILASLLPPASTPARAMLADPRIGLVAPAGFLLPIREWVLANQQPMRRLAAALGKPLERTDFAAGTFAAGSMFWFRRTALADFATGALLDRFEPEAGQTDGTAAHAIERLFALLAAKRGTAVLAAAAVPQLRPDLSDMDLATLTRQSAAAIDPSFRKPPATRFAARHLPLLFRAYGRLPVALRRRLRRLAESG